MTPYYQREGVTLYHGDSREVLRALEPVDHVISDPPYLIDLTKCVAAGKRAKYASKGDHRHREIEYAPFTNLDVETIAPEIARLARRWAIVFSDAESNHVWREQLCESNGMTHVRVGAWVRTNATPQFSGDRPATGFELCEVAHGAGVKMRWNGGGMPACWPFGVRAGISAEGGQFHPTPKPLDLIVCLVEQFTDPGETILDPYAGSGSLGAACVALGRNAILVEREEKFCAGIAKRCGAQPVLWRAGRSRMRQAKLAFGDTGT